MIVIEVIFYHVKLKTYSYVIDAICIDNNNPTGYECLCREGYIDTSPTPSVRPGIRCQKRRDFIKSVCTIYKYLLRLVMNECRSPLLNDCDRNSFCIDRPIGFRYAFM